MLHKISDFCDKIDSIKKMSDMLREMKYGIDKSPNEAIDNMIASIQHDCLMVSKDKSEYIKKEDNA
jgi:TATA-box binding protein (TBP) (component of TFIID and TFIIIB)